MEASQGQTNTETETTETTYAVLRNKENKDTASNVGRNRREDNENVNRMKISRTKTRLQQNDRVQN